MTQSLACSHVHVSKFLHLQCYVIFRAMLIINEYDALFGQ